MGKSKAKYPKTLDKAKVWVKSARREIDDAEELGKVLDLYLQLEGILKNGRDATKLKEQSAAS